MGEETTGGGVATGLQPSGTGPGAQPGASKGSIGTGGGSTAGEDTGNVARRERKFGEEGDEASAATKDER